MSHVITLAQLPAPPDAWRCNLHQCPEDPLEFLREAVGGPVDVVTAVVDGIAVDVWCNDEALLVPEPQFNPLATALVGDRSMYGNCVIAAADGDETRGLTWPEVELVVMSIADTILAFGGNLQAGHD